jgi:hypothetical protein
MHGPLRSVFKSALLLPPAEKKKFARRAAARYTRCMPYTWGWRAVNVEFSIKDVLLFPAMTPF